MFKKRINESIAESERIKDITVYPSDGIELSDLTVLVFGGFPSENQVQFYVNLGSPYVYYIKKGAIISCRESYNKEPVHFEVKEYSLDENKLVLSRIK